MKIPSSAKATLLAGSSILAFSGQIDVPKARVPAGYKTAAVTLDSGKATGNPLVAANTRYEVAPAGTYARLKQTISTFQTEEQANRPTDVVPITWDAEISDLLQSAMEEAIEMDQRPSDAISAYATDILRICAGLYTSEPLVSLGDDSGLEIFLKENDRALLFVLQPDEILSIFGDEPDEQWRGRYSLSGENWRRRVPDLISEMISA